MRAEELHERAAARADELPGSLLTHPFGPEWGVYKVRGRMFMALARLRGEPIVNLKARPADSEVLQHAYAEIEPGYHMNKRHWITVRPGIALDHGMFEDLITESYLLVLEKLPRAVRPVDPDTFGRRV